MNIPRPGDAFYLDVTYRDGTTTRFPMNATSLDDAYYETAYVLGGCGDIYVPENHRNPHGRLYRADGDLVTEGDTRHFEELSLS